MLILQKRHAFLPHLTNVKIKKHVQIWLVIWVKNIFIKKCKPEKSCVITISEKSAKKIKKHEKKCLKLKILWDTLIEWSAGHGD